MGAAATTSKIEENHEKDASPEVNKAAAGSSDDHIAHRSSRARRGSVTGLDSDIHTFYTLGDEMGRGHFGVVKKCQKKDTKEYFAVKTIRKKLVDVPQLKAEMDIMKKLTDHKNVIKVYEVFEDEHSFHIVQELASGGELFDRITARGHYTEHDASVLTQTILAGVDYIHKQDVCHRDLKPENFLFATEEENSDLKIIDFGLSRMHIKVDSTTMSTRVGTPFYIAPEVLHKKYTTKCDIWSIGVIVYILLCGYPPFYGPSDIAIYQKIIAGKYSFDGEVWDKVSDHGKEFVGLLLQLDPDDRPSATEALEHPWIKEHQPKVNLMNATMRDSMQTFVNEKKLKKAALQVMAEQLTEDEILKLKTVFKELDSNKTNTISVKELSEAMHTAGYANVEAELRKFSGSGLDLDPNHQINYSEWLAVVIRRNAIIREEKIIQCFKQFDKDQNGVLTLKNLEEIFGSPEHAAEVMKEVDLNGDGVISLEEFKECVLSDSKSASLSSNSGLDHVVENGATSS